jgi:hypothetical protein
MRLCQDCSHQMSSCAGWVCTRPLSDRRSLVTGALDDRLAELCSDERKQGRRWLGFGPERCGPEAKFFEHAVPSKRRVDA